MRQKGLELTTPTVNELSNTIDLTSTLLRAQHLFRRFQRTIEAVDRKGSFPTPTVRQRKLAVEPAPSSPSSLKGKQQSTQPKQNKINANPGAATASGSDQRPETESREKVISPELRNLLSRKVEKLDKRTVVEHGGGVG